MAAKEHKARKRQSLAFRILCVFSVATIYIVHVGHALCRAVIEQIGDTTRGFSARANRPPNNNSNKETFTKQKHCISCRKRSPTERVDREVLDVHAALSYLPALTVRPLKDAFP